MKYAHVNGSSKSWSLLRILAYTAVLNAAESSRAPALKWKHHIDGSPAQMYGCQSTCERAPLSGEVPHYDWRRSLADSLCWASSDACLTTSEDIEL